MGSSDATQAKHHGGARHDHEHEEDVECSRRLAKDVSEVDPRYFRSARYIGSLVGISLTTMSCYFGFAVPASVLTFINEDIGPSPNASLFSIIWTMCNAISILLVGRITDKFGKRHVSIVAGVWVIVGAAVAGTAKSMNTLIGANVIIGIGSGVHSSSGVFIGELVPHRYKFYVQATILVPMVVATGFGAIIGRSLVESQSWRWIYYIYIILCGAGWLLQVLYYHPATFTQLHGAKRSKWQEFKRVDHPGIFLLVAGLTLFLLGISWGGNPQPWDSALILGLTISGAVTLVAFVLWESLSNTPNPIVDLSLFKRVRTFTCINIVSWSAGTLYIAMTIMYPQQVVRLFSNATTSWQTVAWTSTTVGFGIWGGIILLFPFVNAIGYIKWQVVFWLALSTAFLGAMASVRAGDRAMAIAASFLSTFGAGWLETGGTVLVQIISEDEDVGVAYAMLRAGQSISGAIFTAVFLAILNGKAPGKVQLYVTEAALGAGLPESSLPKLFEDIVKGAPSFADVPGMTTRIGLAVQSALVRAYADSYSLVYYAALAVGLASLIAALCMADLDRYMTGHIPKQVYTKEEREIQISNDSDTKEAPTEEHVEENKQVQV
ncbi:uncharacterized protein PV06_03211 [Exophiala oligosperma]|uniref:Major facilitator superfamily (MFS) profile domain-containing protein n=1 Tax=Exophiala oligosperma TaxID=215243 RepID=A0A0D2DPL2_9EURO|nr:uncharacterized protein PV06_03211 [Exophiala oligosperma]KIW44763.1 hypothetical protein PV06_03211 [Exophiala oligosperma]